jgi:hypothetical protein
MPVNELRAPRFEIDDERPAAGACSVVPGGRAQQPRACTLWRGRWCACALVQSTATYGLL